MAERYKLIATRNVQLLSHNGAVLMSGKELWVEKLTDEDKEQERLGALRIETIKKVTLPPKPILTTPVKERKSTDKKEPEKAKKGTSRKSSKR